MNPEILQTTELLGSLLQAKVLDTVQTEMAKDSLTKCLEIIDEQVNNMHRILTN